ncbi:hypothetical protein [Microbacter margulisiae]|uniref:Uncharacterized protein n=1 Tax=Microbacter margulisiae TaxID=1350067 RepID=A0A7W5H3E4_9PORP|nr:hypothetical protein [Microbacter margulisiae]MBB3188524.1 hypothetical protein [Microbacter margulisiae]
MKFYSTLFIFVLFSIASCHGRNVQEDEICGKQISKALGDINNYYFTKQTAYLDSAIFILKSIENKSDKYRNIIYSDEVHAYFLHKDFSLALTALNKVPASVYPFPAFKDILEDKIKAKEAETKGDKPTQIKFFRALILIYQHYINENYQVFVTTLRQTDPDKIDNSQIDFIVTELYYYIAQTEGIHNAINQLNVFQKSIKGNRSYFSELKKYIQSNNASSMGILLY